LRCALRWSAFRVTQQRDRCHVANGAGIDRGEIDIRGGDIRWYGGWCAGRSSQGGCAWCSCHRTPSENTPKRTRSPRRAARDNSQRVRRQASGGHRRPGLRRRRPGLPRPPLRARRRRRLGRPRRTCHLDRRRHPSAACRHRSGTLTATRSGPPAGSPAPPTRCGPDRTGPAPAGTRAARLQPPIGPWCR